ncbi:MAG: 2-hydroxychromene-2-carboxylate isomerase [Pseudomonadales bacterium]|nr:2-hydroxychromene-2-carboxylate isomerase [Pseudomonadales bacterium]
MERHRVDTVEFYFDCSSPWTYLGFETMQSVISRHPGLAVEYKPILVGGIFNSVNPSVYENRANPVPVKQKYYGKDLRDWARFVGITIGSPPVFPVNSVKAMRGAFVALEQDCLVPYARAVFRHYWTELEDISRDEILAGIVREVGLDEKAFFAAIASQPYKDRLRENTEEVIARGGFGSPTFFLNGDDMYFGNDRIVLLESRLTGAGG